MLIDRDPDTRRRGPVRGSAASRSIMRAAGGELATT